MTKILDLARENWTMSTPPIEMGEENGIAWAICRGTLAGISGAALVPEHGHPWSDGLPSEFRGLAVHGGISWTNGRWIGFDTAHAFDYWDEEYDPNRLQALLKRQPSKLFQDIDWTPEMVIEEAKSLARQLSSLRC